MKLTKKQRLMQQLNVTEADVQTIQRAAMQVWHDISFDVLAAVAEEKGKTAEEVTISRRDIIELVLDASRLETELNSRKNTKTPLSVDGQAFVEYCWQTGPKRDLMQILMIDTFPYSRCGL